MLLGIVVGDRLTGGGIVEGSGVGEPDFKIVAQFSDGADRRARGFNRIGLLDRYRWTDIFHVIDLRAVEQVDELARVGRKGLDVASLTLCMQGLEYERRLPCPTEPRHDGELSDRQIEVEACEVVLADAAQADEVVGSIGHGQKSLGKLDDAVRKVQLKRDFFASPFGGCSFLLTLHSSLPICL